MLAELERLLDGMTTANPAAMRAAVVEGNLLGKATQRTRLASWQRLSRLYGLAEGSLTSSGFLPLWQAEPGARPQLALAHALTRDSLLRLSAPSVLSMRPGQEIRPAALMGALRTLGIQYSEKTLRSTAQNLLSSWTQAGLLSGKTRKKRREVDWHPATIALLLHHAFLAGQRGAALYESPEFIALGLTPEQVDRLAVQAGQRGLLSYKRIGEVVEITFPDLDRAEGRR